MLFELGFGESHIDQLLVSTHNFLMLKIYCLFFFSIAAMAAPKELKTVIGIFESIQAGDYTHLTIKNIDGKTMSFICSSLPKSEVKGLDCMDFEIYPERVSAKRLKVTYFEEVRFIKEANEKIKWNYVDRIDYEK